MQNNRMITVARIIILKDVLKDAKAPWSSGLFSCVELRLLTVTRVNQTSVHLALRFKMNFNDEKYANREF